MRDNKTDLALLYDIWMAAKDIIEFTEVHTLNSFANDKKTRLAVERQIEVIAEAMKRLREEFKEDHPEIPWQKIIAQRNIIAHEYDKLQVEKIWLAASESVPQLLPQIEALIPKKYRESN